MVHTMFTDIEGCVIINKGTSNEEGRRVRPTASAQDDGYPGGPVDKYVLRKFDDHVATRLWDGEDRGELRVFSNNKKLKETVIEHEQVEQLVKSYGLYSLLKCSYKMIDKWIIYVFIERWHRDTNNFHLPIGEITITLDDVSSLMHIPITGAFFSINVFNMDDGAIILTELLGVTVVAAYAECNVTRTTTVRFSWLLEVYHQPCHELHWQMAARTFFLGYAWDAAALAYLYDNLCEQFLDCCRLSPNYVDDYSRALRWKPKRDKGLIIPFRKALDEIDFDQIGILSIRSCPKHSWLTVRDNGSGDHTR
uniref:Protein MAIN-LIKE 1-like n=1 Tax=Cicer arietinum TaxID=3827 RepID=A0A1S2XJG4_CICAR|nr:protein MAIN-LIKE 1-like [Cicer arietinum]